MMRSGNREDLAEIEDRQAAVLHVYLPAQMAEAEVRALVSNAVAGGAMNVGAVMKQVMPAVKGRFDGKALNDIVREALAAAEAA